MLMRWLLLTALVCPGLALDNGLALTPPMGWLTWERFRCITDCKKYPQECISEQLIERTAQRMVEDGYLDAGYNYIGIDDCWLEKERVNGRIVPDKKRFPKGMKALSDFIHARGLKFGIYEDYGTKTCAGYPGVLNHEQDDIDTFVEWDVDYIKLDGCYIEDVKEYDIGYPAFGKKLNASGRPILYSCSWPAYQEDAGVKPNYAALARHCNLWRNWEDIDDSWSSISSIMQWFGDNQDRFAEHAGPGHWNDPDMLIIGNYGLTIDQARVQMAVWAVLAAPLLMSVDLDTIRPEFKEILLNKEVIAVNQDILGKQGLRVWQNKLIRTKTLNAVRTYEPNDNLKAARDRRAGIDIWKRDLVDGSYAIAFVNHRTDGAPYAARFNFTEMGLKSGCYAIIDLYKDEDDSYLKDNQEFEVRINPTGVKFYKFIPKEVIEDEEQRYTTQV